MHRHRLPGFGLSTARAGYGFAPREHAEVLTGFVDAVGLDRFSLVMQDWGGPIGLQVALDEPDRIETLIPGNTWAWPREDQAAQRFSSALGEGRTGEFPVDRANVFVNVFLRRAMRRRSVTGAEMERWRGPFLEKETRVAVRVMPREVNASRDW